MNNQIQVLNQVNSSMPANINAGAVTIEAQRAITEAQSKIQIAKMFPRNEQAAFEKLMFACSHAGFAEDAFYSVPRGDGKISGPSIRLAEEIARVYGNFTYGQRELSRDQGKSEVEVFAWDVENNNYTSRQITVMHIQDTKSGGYALKTQADIDTRIANIASKQLRGRILSLIPKWMLAEATARCRATLAGAGQDQSEREKRIATLEARFASRNVSKENLEHYLGHPLKLITDDEIADLFGVYTAIKEGTDKNEFFIDPKAQQTDTALRLESAINGNNAKGETAANPIEGEKQPKKAKQSKKTDKPQAQSQPEPEQTDPSVAAAAIAQAALDAQQDDTPPVDDAEYQKFLENGSGAVSTPSDVY